MNARYREFKQRLVLIRMMRSDQTPRGGRFTVPLAQPRTYHKWEPTGLLGRYHPG